MGLLATHIGSTNSQEWKCAIDIYDNGQSTTSNYTNVTVKFYFTRTRSSSYAQNGATTAWININGSSDSVYVPAYNYSSIGVNDWKFIAERTVRVNHNTLGDKWVDCSASWSQSGVQPNSASVAGGASLPTIKQTIGTPSNVTVKGIFQVNNKLTLSWSNGSGPSNYTEIDVAYCKDNTWGEWTRVTSINGTPTSHTYTVPSSASDKQQIKFRVRRYNSVSYVYSNWGTSNILGYVQQIKVWSGSAWVNANIKVWNGSTWVEGKVKVFNGS